MLVELKFTYVSTDFILSLVDSLLACGKFSRKIKVKVLYAIHYVWLKALVWCAPRRSCSTQHWPANAQHVTLYYSPVFHHPSLSFVFCVDAIATQQGYVMYVYVVYALCMHIPSQVSIKGNSHVYLFIHVYTKTPMKFA